MAEPQFADYIHLIYRLFERFRQTQPPRMKWSRPARYQEQTLISFFMLGSVRK
jgi:hypothetical protein